MRRSIALAGCAALAAGALALPTSATLRPARPPGSIADPVDGELFKAPEITGMTAAVDDACTIVLTDQMANRPAMYYPTTSCSGGWTPTTT